MHAVSQGEGPAVLFCHGFPGLWYSWRHQLPVMADAGFRAIAVDMRGYGRSDRPLSATDYGNQTIVGDLTGVLDALGEEQAVFVGHDFGAQAAWAAALHAPERVRGVVSLAVPYGVGFAGGAKTPGKRTTTSKERGGEGHGNRARPTPPSRRTTSFISTTSKNWDQPKPSSAVALACF